MHNKSQGKSHYLPSVALAWLLAFAACAPAWADECVPTCGQKECGGDGCGGSCGACPLFHGCFEGQCQFNGGCEAHGLAGCGGCACEACVCGTDPFCCTAAWDSMCVARCNLACGGCGTKAICGDGTCSGSEDCSACPFDCGECPKECGSVTTVGCCVGEVLFRCNQGELAIENCSSGPGATCGWSLSQKRYMCGEQGFDTSLTWPRECPSITQPDVVSDAPSSLCQDVPFAGCCLGNSVWYCDSNGLHQVSCAGNPPPYDVCGWNSALGYYDCGGTLADPTGTFPMFCPDFNPDLKEETTATPECKVGELIALECGDVTERGCCSESGALVFCQEGELLCMLKCQQLMPPSNTCGWYVSGGSGYYDCGGVGPDPAGQFQRSCPALPVDLDVIPGDVTAKPCPGVAETGCCSGSLLRWCEQGVVMEFDCLDLGQDALFSQYTHCGHNLVTGRADCVKVADPSPPKCEETPVEPDKDVSGGDVADGGQELLDDLAEDVNVAEDGVGELSQGDADSDLEADVPRDVGSDDNPWAPDSGIVIPLDESSTDVTEEAKGKGGGGCGVVTSLVGAGRNEGLGLLLLLALLALGARRQAVNPPGNGSRGCPGTRLSDPRPPARGRLTV